MDAETVRQVLTALYKPQMHKLDSAGEHQIAILPEGFTVHDLRGSLPPPDRIKQKVTLLTPDDFSAYIIAYGAASTGSGVSVFADEPTARYEAVLDYHLEDGERGPCEHVVTYACPLSLQWQTWIAGNRASMKQEQFARFIEDNRPDIYKPPAGDMLQIALQLQVHKSAKFDSDIRLSNGQRQLAYMEEVRGTTKSGNLEIPEEFSLKLPVFVDGAHAVMDARLRYRMADGVLTMWYELVRYEDVLGAAVKLVTGKIRDALREKTPNAKLLIGKRG